MLAASEDEEIQKNGTVGVVINTGVKPALFNIMAALDLAPMVNYLPLRCTAFHFW
jgi:hypothetical protein